ncbi:MAG: DsrE/DsrF/DrsH-like family protein, partial [Proteobacteria bacterium]|nr:DsrE/DsrF/DrsH-like family protein [Pseudomonadota bacterium]
KLPAHLVVESVGVRPNSALAAAAGLELGPRGHIVVDASLRTSDPNIYAAGDVIEVEDPVLGGKTAVPLAGPANKQGRIVADNIAGGNSRYRGSYAASIIKIGRYALAAVGATERRLKQQAVAYLKIYSHPSSHATYYPGSTQMHAKLLFAPDGKILGVQCVGMDGADKRIDVIATAMQQNLLAPDLAWLELTYAPPFNSAKDPVNTLGMIADNVLTGKSDVIHADALPKDAILLDVRQPEEHTQGTLPGSINMPLPQLRNRLGELDKSRFYVTFCRVGMRGYLAERILKQSGFKAANLSGGFLTWQSVCPAPLVVKKKTQPTQVQPTDTADDEVLPVETLDVRGMACPGPIVNLKQAFDALKPNDQIKLLAETSFEPDLVKWSAGNGCTILHLTRENDHLEASLKKGEPGTSGNATMASSERRTAIVLFSNDLDKSIAAFIIACGMAASGAKTAIFFTFWGLTVLRKEHPPETKKDFVSKLFGRMLPKGPKGLKLSQLNMAGMGTAMMKDIMAQKNVSSLPDLIEQARALGVTFIACEMAMGIMGIKREELIAVDEVAGVASLAELSRGGNVLFI